MPSPTWIKKGNAISVEIECCFPYGIIETGYCDSDYCCGECEEHDYSYLYAKLNKYRKNIYICHDSSIECNGNAAEIVVTASVINIKQILTYIMNIIKKLGGYVNASCGMHVHYDMRAKKLTEIDRSHLEQQARAIMDYVSKDRLHSGWCAPTTKNGKYSAINLNTGYDTIEVRAHEGCLNANKAIRWIMAMHQVIYKRKRIEECL